VLRVCATIAARNWRPSVERSWQPAHALGAGDNREQTKDQQGTRWGTKEQGPRQASDGRGRENGWSLAILAPIGQHCPRLKARNQSSPPPDALHHAGLTRREVLVPGGKFQSELDANRGHRVGPPLQNRTHRFRRNTARPPPRHPRAEACQPFEADPPATACEPGRHPGQSRQHRFDQPRCRHATVESLGLARPQALPEGTAQQELTVARTLRVSLAMGKRSKRMAAPASGRNGSRPRPPGPLRPPATPVMGLARPMAPNQAGRSAGFNADVGYRGTGNHSEHPQPKRTPRLKSASQQATDFQQRSRHGVDGSEAVSGI